MKIDISFRLNTVEQGLFLQQIREEFAQHVNEFNRLKQILPKSKDDKRRVNIQRGINVQGMKCRALCTLLREYNVDGCFTIRGDLYSFEQFVRDTEFKYSTASNNNRKLKIHIMHKAGIISKEKMQEILKLRQYNGEERTFKVLSHFKDEIQKNLNAIENRIDIKDLRKIVNGTNYLLGCIRDVMESKKNMKCDFCEKEKK